MKKVAIITMHRVYNYGSILQTIALNIFLRDNGYMPIVVDYLFPNEYHKSVAKKKSIEVTPSWFRSHLNGLCQCIMNPDRTHKQKGFSDYIERFLTLTAPYTNERELNEQPVKADIYLTGSDQVWNPRYIGEDLAFFLSWVPQTTTALKISYGASFGNKRVDKSYLDYISPWLKKYDAISVREDNEILPAIGIAHKIVLDPSFLLNKEQWSRIIDTAPIVKGKYLLCYIIGYSFNPFPFADKVVRHIRRKTGYKVVMIAGEPRNILQGYKVINDCTPEDFLNLFYNASYVITSSFHGTAFAINFGIPFTTIVDNKSDNDNRQVSLVNAVGLDGCGILKKNSQISQMPIMNRDVIAPRLEQLRQESIHFLINALRINEPNND